MRPCEVPGCTKQRDGYSHYCGPHKRRQRRHGSPTQKTISATTLRSHRDAIKRWLDGRPDPNGWDPLRTLFGHVVGEARTELELSRTRASPRYLRQAHEDIVKVAGEGPQVVDQAILTVAAMYDLHHWQPTSFASDDGFRVQLARRFRAHSDVNVAVSWSQTEGRNKRVYRDASSRRLVTLGQLLSRALGSVSLTIIATMAQEATAKAQERQEAIAQLQTPLGTPATRDATEVFVAPLTTSKPTRKRDP
jgi:hypothetical protein